MIEPTAVIALAFENGTIGRMQFYDEPTDKNINAAINKTLFSAGTVKEWKRVNIDDRAVSIDDFKAKHGKSR